MSSGGVCFVCFLFGSISVVTPLTMAGFCSGETAWFAAQWAEFETGCLDQRGATETELVVALCMASVGVFGTAFFRTSVRVPLLGRQPLHDLTLYSVLLFSACSLLATLTRTVTAKRGALSTVSGTPLLHIGLHVAASMLLATSPVSAEAPLAVFVAVGLSGTTLMTKMRLTASTRTPWPAVHLDALPFCAAALARAVLGTRALAALLLWQAAALTLLWCDSVARLCGALGVPFLAEVPAEVAARHAKSR
eukprot:NODE_2019_length_1012_cov_226.491118.p1 GENE.NODE_2019_length_1012_cov_226.491118~~NODE_2019_length_1012_cov_226.491118.p1  ORF type:complete len:291 (+),score=118.99 NODE_2019_length_1012_cov_226.491118:125-874(+)